MTEENAFTGYVRIVTKSYGILNDPDDGGGTAVTYKRDIWTSKDSRSIIFDGAKFVTSGNATFLVGVPYGHHLGELYTVALNIDLLEGPEITTELWIPVNDIISIIPSYQGEVGD